MAVAGFSVTVTTYEPRGVTSEMTVIVILLQETQNRLFTDFCVSIMHYHLLSHLTL